MHCDVDDDGPNVGTEHGHLEQCEEVVPLQDCDILLNLGHVAIFLVDEVFVRVQEITTGHVELLNDGKDFNAAEEHKDAKENDNGLHNLKELEHVRPINLPHAQDEE